MEEGGLDQRARFLVKHCYHLKARMKVTPYILDMRPPSSRALRSLPNRVSSRLLGAVVVIQSTGAPRKSCPFKKSLARSGGIPRKYSLPCHFREFSHKSTAQNSALRHLSKICNRVICNW